MARSCGGGGCAVRLKDPYLSEWKLLNRPVIRSWTALSLRARGFLAPTISLTAIALRRLSSLYGTVDFGRGGGGVGEACARAAETDASHTVTPRDRPCYAHCTGLISVLHDGSDQGAAEQRADGARPVGVDVKVILTPPCIFCIENR